MTGLIGALRVTLGADTAAFEKGMKRARGEMSAMQKASGALKAAFVGMAGVLAIDQIAGLAKSGLEYASSLGEVASQLGVSTRALQEYRYAASQTGIEQGEMDKALAQLTRRLGAAAAGAKAPSDALKALGVNLRDAKGNIIDAGDAIPLIAEGLKKIESPAQRAKLLVDLFGKAGQQFAPLMEGGAAGVNSLRDAAQELGLVLSDKQIQNADEAADKLAALKQVLEAKIAGSVADNTDSILALVDALIKLVDVAGKAAKAWSMFARLDFSSVGGSFATGGIYGAIQNMRTQGDILTHRDAVSASDDMLTPSARAAIQARKDARFLQPSGGSLIAPRQAAPNPWLKKAPSLLQRGNAVGGGMAAFAPGLGGEGWIKAATSGYGDLAARAAEVAASNAAAKAELAEMAKVHGPQLLASVKALSPAMDELRARTQGILDRLFPEQAEARQFQEELTTLAAALKQGQLSAEDYARAVAALRQEFTGFAQLIRDNASEIATLGVGSTVDDALAQATASWERFRDGLEDGADVSRVQVVETFEDMANDVLGSLNQLSGAIRGGGFLDILSSVIGLGLKLGDLGLFGKSVQDNIRSVPGRAFGGPVMANTPYIVGERRAELFVPSSSGRIEPNPGNGRRGGGDSYHFSGNLLTPEWWAQIQKGFDDAAARGAIGGATIVSERTQKQARSRLGRRG